MADARRRRRGKAYTVGYGKPPAHTRFQPGRSGNPKGRPRGRLNFATELREALTAPVTVTIDGEKRSMSRRRAMLERLLAKALAGDVKATLALIELSHRHLAEETAAPRASALEAEDAAVIEAFLNRLQGGPRDDAP